MQQGFWKNLPKPFFVLAPMANVTDSVFRRIYAKYGKPDVSWTEFVSADGLCSPGKPRLMTDLRFSEEERPVVAQFFTSKSDKMYETAKLALELGFDGIDINMGCPESNIQKQGSGACLIKTPEIARALIQAAREGSENKLPISVKTRLGYNTDILEEWLPALLEAEPAVVTLHARTKKEMSKVPAKWERVADAVKIRDEFFKGKSEKTFIIGNGDVKSLEEAEGLAKTHNIDGIMIGRGLFGNPWFFSRKTKKENLPTEEILRVLLEHTKAYWEELVSAGKHFDYMKKNYKAYATGFDGAAELRAELYECKDYESVKEVVNKFLKRDNE